MFLLLKLVISVELKLQAPLYYFTIDLTTNSSGLDFIANLLLTVDVKEF